MADVAASPDKLVVEGRLAFTPRVNLAEPGSIMIGSKQLLYTLYEWTGANEFANVVRPDGTYRITVERLPDAK